MPTAAASLPSTTRNRWRLGPVVVDMAAVATGDRNPAGNTARRANGEGALERPVVTGGSSPLPGRSPAIQYFLIGRTAHACHWRPCLTRTVRRRNRDASQ